MKPQPPFVEYVIEQFSTLGAPTARAMMGGWVIYIDGLVCALIADSELYLKGGANNIPAFDARGLKAFKPFEDQDLVMKYYQAPPEIFEDPAALREWVGGSLEASRRTKKRAGEKPSKKSSRKR